MHLCPFKEVPTLSLPFLSWKCLFSFRYFIPGSTTYVSSTFRPTASRIAYHPGKTDNSADNHDVRSESFKHRLSITRYLTLFIQMDPADPLLSFLVFDSQMQWSQRVFSYFFLIANIYYVHDITSYLHITVRLSTSIARYAKSFSGGEGML